NQVEHKIDLLQVKGVTFKHYRKHKIADHRKANREQHIRTFLDEKNGQDAVKNKRKFYTQVNTIYISQAGAKGVE
ncbi:hypothetical protein RSW80_26695, partial [Escherichia coli]|uniref:hypothetical protein n=1 Tax=Escherichia coli TaxID=562 RepID=UPI0028DEC37E